MKKKPAFAEFIEQIPIILIKGFVACLIIGLVLEFIGIDLLAGKSIYTHGWQIFGAMFSVGLPLHYFFWRT
jgi:TctA family transporter